MTEEQQYLPMDQILQKINRDFIALPVEEVEENNSFLYELLDAIIDLMKAESKLFALLYSKKFFGGSYWDRVKIGRPDEYDVHIQCQLKNYTQILEPSNKPGWVNLKFAKQINLEEKKKRRRYRKPFYGIPGLHALINVADYLDTEKVLLWFHQTLANSLGGYRRNKQRYCTVSTPQGDISMKFRRHGPAFTFSIKNLFDGDRTIMLDFVPCFVFGESQYPVAGFIKNPTTKGETFIVAKPIKSNVGTRYWRLSFQNQERELIKDRANFKPALRLLKKMRDKLRHDRIVSYFLKNLMLWEIDERSPDFWGQPLSYVFMTVLKSYQDAIQDKIISFYWYPADNLIESVKNDELISINKKLIEVIEDINRSPGNIRVAKFFLTRKEYLTFSSQYKSQ